MSDNDGGYDEPQGSYNPRFVEFFQMLASLEGKSGLFPKNCRTCGRGFHSFEDFAVNTEPKAHVFEDGSDVMGSPYTMVYRHCSCGNTLVLTLTDGSFPELDRLWETLNQESERTGKTLKEVTLDFREQLDIYIAKRRKKSQDRIHR